MLRLPEHDGCRMLLYIGSQDYWDYPRQNHHTFLYKVYS